MRSPAHEGNEQLHLNVGPDSQRGNYELTAHAEAHSRRGAPTLAARNGAEVHTAMLPDESAYTSTSGLAGGSKKDHSICICLFTCQMGTSSGALLLPRRLMGAWAAKWACRTPGVFDDRAEPWTTRAQKRIMTVVDRGVLVTAADAVAAQVAIACIISGYTCDSYSAYECACTSEGASYPSHLYFLHWGAIAWLMHGSIMHKCRERV